MERKVLSEAFQVVLGERRVRAAIFLTFRFDPGFFEQEILPVFFDVPLSHAPQVRLLHLEQVLRETGPVAVYFDRRALEAGAAPPRTDFQRIGLSPRTGYFHPKNVLLLVEAPEAVETPPRSVEARRSSLIVASMSANLTRAGWWQNVEAAHIEEANEGERCGFRDDLVALAATLRRSAPPDTAHGALDQIEAFLRRTEQDPQRLRGGRLVPRLFAGGDLPEFLSRVAGSRLRGRCLEVISPYFDDQESMKPLQALMERFAPRETRVFLPRGREREALCSKTYWEAMRNAGVTWAQLPSEVTRLSRDTERFVHAKVYRFFDPGDGRETIFVGSANLTNAGCGKGGNVESGFVVELVGKRRNDWWLAKDEGRPAAFVHEAEEENLGVGPGASLVLRFDWRTETAHGFWDSASASPRLLLRSAGVDVGSLGPLETRSWRPLPEELSARLRESLRSSSFVTVVVEGAPDATVLVDEEGATHKPSLLTTLSPDEILRFWSLLTAEQKQEFIEAHADELDDPEIAVWMGSRTAVLAEDGLFGTFAHVYLSFANLEQAVRRALEEGRRREAVDRLFGRKFDSLRRLVERLDEERRGETQDPVRAYVTLLCATQLLDALAEEQPRFRESEDWEPGLARDVRSVMDAVKGRLDFAGEPEQQAFFAWFERWFLRRAIPLAEGTAG